MTGRLPPPSPEPTGCRLLRIYIRVSSVSQNPHSHSIERDLTSSGDQIDVQDDQESPWRERVRALKNMPPVLRILWDSGPGVVAGGLVLRVIVAVLPFALAKVAQFIIQDIADKLGRGMVLPKNFWILVATEVGLNVLLGLMTRAIDYSDSLLANRYTQHVSVRVMEQAARLDLTTYENPVFYDRLERARVQATDRLAMIQQMGRLFQQVITTLAFSAAPGLASPWLVLLLALGVFPSFLGETHYAFLGYAKNFRQTPAKRQMDYLRQVAGSREGAKEVKLFGLNKFFTDRFQALADADLRRGRRHSRARS